MKYLGLSLRARVCRTLKDIRFTSSFVVLEYTLTFIYLYILPTESVFKNLS